MHNRVALTAAEEEDMDDFYVFGGYIRLRFLLCIFIVAFVLIITTTCAGHRNLESE